MPSNIVTDSSSTDHLAGIPWKIYISRFLSAWGDRMWAFGGGIFMTKLDQSDSLRLVALYGLISSISIILFGAAIGNWIDRNKRLTTAKVFLSIQNISVATCCSVLGFYFWQQQRKKAEVTWGDAAATMATTAIVIVVSNVASLASLGSRIVVEKDWIVVIAGDDKGRLAAINSVFRTIDLTCNILAPLLAGVLFDCASKEFTAAFIACWNVASVVVELMLLVKIYQEYPNLARKAHLVDMEKESKAQEQKISKTIDSWLMYYNHPVRNAGFGLSLLYMTVLGFDNITYGYCLLQCVKESVLGSLVGFSAVIGVLGSLSFPFLRQTLNMQRAGIAGMLLLVLALSNCVVSIWLPGSPFEYYAETSNSTLLLDSDKSCYVESFWSVGVLLFGIIVARYGLWISDLSITQILQEEVAEKHRGTLGGVQGGLNSAMETVKFSLVILLPNESSFGWLVLASFTSICLGSISYAVYAVKNWHGAPDIVMPLGSEAQATYNSFEHNNGGKKELGLHCV